MTSRIRKAPTLWQVVLQELEFHGPVVEQKKPFISATRVLMERLMQHNAPLPASINTSTLSVVLQGLREAKKIIIDQERRGGIFRGFYVPTYEAPIQVELTGVRASLREDEDLPPFQEEGHGFDYRTFADTLVIACAEILSGGGHENCIELAHHQATEDALKQACEERDSISALHSEVENNRKNLETLVVELKEACQEQKVKMDSMQHRLSQQEDDIQKLVRALEKERKKGVPLGIHSPVVHQVLDDLLRTMPGTNKGKN